MGEGPGTCRGDTQAARPRAWHRVDARVRVVYLLAVAIGVFLLRGPVAVGLATSVQVALWPAAGLPWRRLWRQLRKLWLFATFIVLTYALTRQDPAIDRWIHVGVGPLRVPCNVAGLVAGATMVLRIVAVVLASQICRAGDPTAIARGLHRIGAPRSVAILLDAVLALFGQGGRGGGGGGRGDGRRRPRRGRHEGAGFWQAVRRLGRGDVAPITDRIERQIARAEAHLAAEGATAGTRIAPRDLAIIAGMTLTMLGIRALKILPSVPFAPGHKLVVLTPLYVLVALLARTRVAATTTGLTMGIVSFLMGDGRYGVFEILKHVAPGVVCDVGVPVLTRGGRHAPGPVAWSLFGGLVAVGRFATIVAITWLVQAPAIAYAILVPGMAVHGTFGVVSGYVTWHLVRSMVDVQRTASELERQM